MSALHPMLAWAKAKGMDVEAIADAAGCSASHLRNLCAGRKDASLSLAKRLSEVSGGDVPLDAFLKPEPSEVRA